MSKKTKETSKENILGKFQVEFGEEKVVQYHEFKDTKMNDETATFLKNYAMEHILSDNDTLINYAFNRILAEQIKKEQEKNSMIRRMLDGEVDIIPAEKDIVAAFKRILEDRLLLEQDFKNNHAFRKAVFGDEKTSKKAVKKTKKVKAPELF